MIDTDVNSLITQHRREVELSDAVKQLYIYPAFKSVFEKNLFKERVNFLVSQLATLSKADDKYGEVVRELDAISYLQNYLQNILTNGAEAVMSIHQAQHYLNTDKD